MTAPSFQPSIMARTVVSDRKPACTACHKAKRKCDKTTPSCRRCLKQNINCHYPPPKPSCFTPIDLPLDATGVEDHLIDFESLGTDLELFSLPYNQLVSNSAETSVSGLNAYSGSWFLEPETFLIDHSPIPIPANFKMSDLKAFVQRLQDWLKEWALTGKNSFIHAQLYQEKFPASIQIAFTTLSAYLHKTDATADMVMRAVNDRAHELVTSIKSISTDRMDVIDILAQTHALLIYQVVALLDGDLRSRSLAEERRGVFMDLLSAMHEKASTALRQSLLEAEFDDLSRAISTPVRIMNREWQSWIVSESVRRTWLLGTGFHACYEGLTRGETLCGGDLALTTREGLWDAEGAHAWSKLCIEKDVRFVGRFRGEWLFSVPPTEVDEFAKMMLEITFGRDRMAHWLSL